MSQENGEDGNSEQQRDGQGRFTPQNQTVPTEQSQPTNSEYVKMNTILQKQSGISAEKFLEYQGKMNAKDLFDKLSFMADNVQPPQQTQKPATLPPNQPTVPISPGTQKVELPGKAIGTQNLTKDGFSVHLKLDSKKLLHPKKTK